MSDTAATAASSYYAVELLDDIDLAQAEKAIRAVVGPSAEVLIVPGGYALIRDMPRRDLEWRLERFVARVLPRPVPAHEVARMRQSVAASAIKGIEVGATVEILDGPYAMLTGTVVSLEDERTVRVLVILRSRPDALLDLPLESVRAEVSG